jgi:uncharacterized protein
MRATVLVALLAAPVLAGCIATPLQSNALGPLPFDAARVLAEGAAAEQVPGALRLVWDAELPIAGQAYEVVVPEGVTFVEARLSWPEGVAGITTPIRESGPERRCPRFQDLSERGWTCRGLTVLDPFPQTWTFDLVPLGSPQGPVPFRMEVDLRGGPLDGPAALIHLDRLSKPQHAIVEEPGQYVEARDGTLLWVEVNRPDVEGPVPTILLSSPYNNDLRAAGIRPYVQGPYHTVPDHVPRGYAVVVADVRGYGLSQGCVEVWGTNEQRDQADLVEWIRQQPWSDGKVGFYGQSYGGTTVIEAIAQGAPLAAAITIAPVVDAYHDWHFGGVPNGENLGSPIGYQMIGAEAPAGAEDEASTAAIVAGSYCGTPEMVARANDPRAVYDDFYRERNFSALLEGSQVPVLYTHGHFDPNVKSQMALHWFNTLEGPKKGLFGPWGHRHPPRADQDLYFHAWWDQHLKGIDTGILRTPPVEVQTEQGQWRGATTWPTIEAQDWALHLDPAGEALAQEAPAASDAQYLALPVKGPIDVAAMLPLWPAPEPPALVQPPTLRFTLPPADHDRLLTGAPMLDLTLTLEGASNTYVAAYLSEQDGDALRPITFGWRNAALRTTYEAYEPVPRGERFALTVPLLPMEWHLAAGKGLVLEVWAPVPSDWAGGQPGEPGQVTLHGGAGLSVLRLPTLPATQAQAVPRAADVRP